MSEEVFVKTSSVAPVASFHTDEDCRALQRAKNYRSVNQEVLFDDLEECSYCAGDYEVTTGEKPHPPDTCRECGADLAPDGTCGFCQRFDEVVAR